jgi:hypothetical protein
MYVMTFAISDNNARAQKTDSGHDTLDNTAHVGAADRVDR